MQTQFAKVLPAGWEAYDRFFAALSDATRQRILLIFDQAEEICVSDITRLFHLSRPAISHHLKVLRNANLVSCEKRGKEVFYRVNDQHISFVLTQVYDRIGQKS